MINGKLLKKCFEFCEQVLYILKELNKCKMEDDLKNTFERIEQEK